MNYNFYGGNYPQTNQLRLDRIANIEEAKRYPIMNGQTVYLLDSEKPIIYMKTIEGLTGYELKPIDISGSNFVTKDDLINFKTEILEALKYEQSPIKQPNDKQ